MFECGNFNHVGLNIHEFVFDDGGACFGFASQGLCFGILGEGLFDQVG